MIRFKVVRASRLLLCLALVVLAAVVAVILISGARRSEAQPNRTAASLVEAAESEARTHAAFASLSAGQATPAAAAGIQIEVVVDEEAADRPDADAPSVLIYHTHTHEAYEQVSDDPYVALEAWRTADDDHSIVRVGEALAGHLRAHGFDVVHDITDHEGNDLPTAYTRSLQTLQGYQRRFDLYIDLHRDAYSEGMPLRFIAEDGTPCARPMVLIGNGVGFDEKPFYEENLAFAKALTRRIDRACPGLCRSVLVKDGRYNQHIGVFSILIEIGHNRNTLDEAINTTAYVANALYSLMIEQPDSALERMRVSTDS